MSIFSTTVPTTNAIRIAQWRHRKADHEVNEARIEANREFAGEPHHAEGESGFSADEMSEAFDFKH